MAQLIFDAIHYLQGSRPPDTQWTQRSPTGPWGFQLWLWASASPIGCPSPQARSCHRDIGKYAHGSTDFYCQLLFVGIAPARHPVDPEKSNRVLGFPAPITSLRQFYGVPVAPSRVIRPLLIGLSSRSTAPLGRRRARHHSSGQQTHRHHLQSTPQLIHKKARAFKILSLW